MNKVKAFFVLVLTSILIACGGGGSGASVSTGDVSISATTNAAEMEPNDSPLNATTLITGTTMNGQLSSKLDQDWYKVTAASAGTISVAFAGTGRNSGGYGWSISILDSASTVLASTTASQNSDSSAQQTIHIGVGAAGTYYVRIKESEGYSYPSSNYTINALTP